MAKMVDCPSCGAEISNGAFECPHCGGGTATGMVKDVINILCVFVGGGALLYVLFY